MTADSTSFLSTLVGVLVLTIAAGQQPAFAKSQASLAQQGYETSRLTQGRGGRLGWFMTKGSERFFCEMKATMALGGKGGMTGFASSGRQIPMNRKAFEAAGGRADNLPQLDHLMRGNVRKQDVGRCVRQ